MGRIAKLLQLTLGFNHESKYDLTKNKVIERLQHVFLVLTNSVIPETFCSLLILEDKRLNNTRPFHFVSNGKVKNYSTKFD